MTLFKLKNKILASRGLEAEARPRGLTSLPEILMASVVKALVYSYFKVYSLDVIVFGYLATGNMYAVFKMR